MCGLYRQCRRIPARIVRGGVRGRAATMRAKQMCIRDRFYIVFFFQLFLLLAILAADLWTVRTFRYYQTLDAVTGETGGETLLPLRIVNDKRCV